MFGDCDPVIKKMRGDEDVDWSLFEMYEKSRKPSKRKTSITLSEYKKRREDYEKSIIYEEDILGMMSAWTEKDDEDLNLITQPSKTLELPKSTPVMNTTTSSAAPIIDNLHQPTHHRQHIGQRNIPWRLIPITIEGTTSSFRHLLRSLRGTPQTSRISLPQDPLKATTQVVVGMHLPHHPVDYHIVYETAGPSTKSDAPEVEENNPKKKKNKKKKKSISVRERQRLQRRMKKKADEEKQNGEYL